MLELDGTSLTYEVFRAKCLEPNHPAIIRNAAASPALPSFDVPALMSQMAPDRLCELLGRDHPVPVYRVHDIDPHEDVAPRDDDSYNGEYPCETKPLEEVLRSWCTDCREADKSARENSGSPQAQERIWYLKDWHMQSEVEAALAATMDSSYRPGEEEESAESTVKECGFEEGNMRTRRHGHGLYQVPAYLGPDWMDCFCVEASRKGSAVAGFGDGKHDYRFAYVGTPHTWTVLHYDVFGSYSWSFNVCGEKLWFFPDGEGNRYLLESLVRGFPTPPDMRVLTGFQYWTCVQHPGDLVFVPSRHFHQVHNLSGHPFPSHAAEVGEASPHTVELTVAVNHNWCNQFCIARMVETFLADVDTLLGMVDVADLRLLFGEGEIEAWRGHVDFMLQGGCNWSFTSLASFLRYCHRVFGEDDHGRVGELLQRLLGTLEAKWAAMFAA